MIPQETIDIVKNQLSVLIELELVVAAHVVCEAIRLTKENPDLTIENAISYAMAEVLK